MGKILYISSVDVSLVDGPGVNEREFIPHLYNLVDGNIHFVIPQPENNLPQEIPAHACSFVISSRQQNPFFFPIHHISVSLKVNKILAREEFDLIVIRSEILPLSYFYLTKKHNIPFALKTANDGGDRVFEMKSFFYRSLRGFNKYLFKDLVKRATTVDVVSTTQVEKVKKITGVKEGVVCIDNGVNVDRFKPKDRRSVKKKIGVDNFDKIIGYAGHLSWKRVGIQIIEALPKLSEHYNIGAIILGGGAKMDTLYEKARSLGVYDRCLFTGKVPYNQVVDYINCMDIGVSQLNEDEQGESEQKVRQYLACGRPVIVSPGEANKFVSKNKLGYIVDPANRKEFIDKIVNILELNSSEYKALSKKNRKYAVRHLSYESKVEKRLKLWRYRYA